METVIPNYIELRKQIYRIIEKAFVFDQISKRLEEAHKYCQTYQIGKLGDSVWHIILDDAIKLREENEKLKRMLTSSREASKEIKSKNNPISIWGRVTED